MELEVNLPGTGDTVINQAVPPGGDSGIALRRVEACDLPKLGRPGCAEFKLFVSMFFSLKVNTALCLRYCTHQHFRVALLKFMHYLATPCRLASHNYNMNIVTAHCEPHLYATGLYNYV